jgi:NADH:ubiquinone oxidoreductase subunit K
VNIPLHHYLLLSAVLFAIGLCGALTRRNAIIVLMAIEVMFNSAILNLVVFWQYRGFAPTPQMIAIFAIAIAAAESTVGLALVIAIYRHYRSVNVEEFNALKG